MIETNVCILGAGPGGASAALKLDRLGIDCLLVDKATFPRDKICGDALSGKVVYALNRIDKSIMEDFYEPKDIKIDCWGVEFVFPKDRKISVASTSFLKEGEQNPRAFGFVSKREDFDNYIIEYVRKSSHIDFREGLELRDFEKVEDGFILKNKDGSVAIKTKLVIAADGAQSKFAREIAAFDKEEKHFAGAIRAYYKNVKGCSEDNFIELHFVEDFAPGYLWIFPLPNGEANVGVGMRSDLISKDKVNLKKKMLEILATHPRFKDRFEEAEVIGKIKGFGLPLGSKKRKISGDHYMLIGDAASLIDPLTGEGIGNAMISGLRAAEHAQRALETANFTAAALKTYDEEVYNHLWKELKISYQIQRALQYPWLTNILSGIATRSQGFTETMTAMFTDVNMRKKIYNPFFYIKLLFQK